MLKLVSFMFANAVAAADPPPVVVVDRDNFQITQSCIVEIGTDPNFDADGNGVIHIIGDNISVEFKPDANQLQGATKDQFPDSFAGTGITIKGSNITIHGAKISGYKVGIHAIESDGLTIENCDVSGNFQQHLKSTPKAEDPSDWLWPHANDDHEWITNYGAGVCVEQSNGVTLCNITAHHGQNGIILDRVNESKVFDCDCSFLSGWGLALWRSNKNVVSRNAFDFCIRGYSHGVYNRGQDSAGILMFEQCCDNIIAENSATHCGDGFFGFAGKEALGEVNPRDDLDWYKERGNDQNWFVKNDFSYAAAHGLELTFSFHNFIDDNTFRSNAICGIWAGFSQRTRMSANTFDSNGETGYGAERGAINIEHGEFNFIQANTFESNRCGIRLWRNDASNVLQMPWGRANAPPSVGASLERNQFHKDQIAIELRKGATVHSRDDAFSETGKDVDTDDQSKLKRVGGLRELNRFDVEVFPDWLVVGKTKPVQRREAMNGRENTIMTEWGPWDHQSTLVRLVTHRPGVDVYALHGFSEPPNFQAEGNVAVRSGYVRGDMFVEIASKGSAIEPYRLRIANDDFHCVIDGAIFDLTWNVRCFASTTDPRTDVDAWHADSQRDGVSFQTPTLEFAFRNGGPGELDLGNDILKAAQIPKDHFGVIASTTLTVPKGKWRIITTSDDGLRVWMDDKFIIDDWTWHGPKEISHDFSVTEAREIPLRVEYFELDGHAILSLEIQSMQ